MNTKRNKLDHSVIPLFVLAVVTVVVLSLILVPPRIGATASLAASSQQGPEMVTVRQSGSTGEDVPLARPGEWAQASVEISGAPDDAVISHVQVKYSVVYSQPGDLEVQLLNSGTEVTHALWNRESAEGPELTRSAGEINAFQGAPVNGTWSLAVKGGEQEGYIDGFSINVYYETDMPVLRQEGGTPGQPGFLRLPEGVTPASLPQDEDEKPGTSEEGSSVVPMDVPPGATILKTENFEGTFPNSLWAAWDTSSDGYERYWDDASCDECGGDWAAWPADRGADYVNVCAGDDYPNNMETWMRYGPFDLSDASSAGTEFVMWREIEQYFDWVYFGVSADGTSFTGIFWDGTAGCTSHNVSYDAWVGDSTVWVAWVFSSDSSVTYEGPWVDDIVIWKHQAVQPCDIRMEPASKTVGQGSAFTFDVWIDNVDDLGGFQFDLDYDPSVVNVDVSSYGGAEPGPFPGSTGRSVFETGPTVNNTTGDMTYGVYTTGAASGASGSGTLATIYFTAENPGTSTLDLSNVQVTDTAGPPVNVIPCNPPVDGTVEVTACSDCRADLDNDGDVDIVDIMTVVGCWGQPCPCP
jgi:hypothetical protein